MPTIEIEHEVKRRARRQVQVVQPNRARDAWFDCVHNKEVRAFRISHVNVDSVRNVEFVEVIFIPSKEINNDRCELLRVSLSDTTNTRSQLFSGVDRESPSGNAPI